MTPEIMLSCFAALLTKHFFCDFPLQTKRMIAEKGTYGATGGLLHCFIHGGSTLAVMALYVPLETAYVLGLIDAGVHYHIDWLKQKLNKGLGLTPADDRFWWLLGVDQYFHGITYVALISLAARKI